MTDIKLEFGATGPVAPQAPGFSTTPAPVYQGATTGAGFSVGTGGDPGVAAMEGGNEMSKSVVGGGMGAITCAADMMVPRSLSSGGDEAGPRIHKELNEILGKKQQELHVQIPPPPLLKGPVGGGGPSPVMVNGAKMGTPQANGMVKPSPTASMGARSAASTPQSRTGTRGATTRAAGGNVSKTIEDACQAAAIEDGVLTPGQRVADPPAKASKAKNGLRRGKWTPEEESYANRLIVEFKAGLLPLTDGTTLRTFLSKLLNCDPMRISKKFVGQNCIGKQVFRRRQVDMDRLTNDDIERSRQELAELERKFLERVAQTNRCKNTSGIAKLPGGKDSGVGQVAPEISRRQQEYMGVGGRSVTGPVISPWMLPPTSGTGTTSSNATSLSDAPPPSSSLLNWDNDARPPQHAARSQGGAGGGVATRRSATTGPATAAGGAASLSVGMPRTDSTDSLFQAAENITPLSDYPRNSSIGDLASLGIFGGSPFQSTENLVGLAAATSAPSPASAASGSGSFSSSSVTQQPPPPPPQPQAPAAPAGEWPPAPAPEFAPSTSQPSSAPYFETSGAPPPAPGPPPASRGEGAMTRSQSNRALPRVESSTGLTSLRVQGGMPRHGSVEDFLSLVACGDIPAPESNILSNSIFSGTANQQRNAAAAQAARVASAAATAANASAGAGASGTYSNFPPPAVISFSGIGKSAGVPQGFPVQPPQQPAMMDVVGGSGKRPRGQQGGDVAVDAAVESGVRAIKQPKMEAGAGGRMYDQY